MARPALNEPFRALIEHSSDLVLTVDCHRAVTFANRSTLQLLGVDTVGKSLLSFLKDEADETLSCAMHLALNNQAMPQTVELKLRGATGQDLWVRATVTFLPDQPHVQGYVVNMRNITKERELEDELAHQSFHDALTGLPNRTLFKDRVQQALNQTGRHHTSFAVMYCDLDSFKAVNDTAGHLTGDELLIEAAGRMSAALRLGDSVARLGGDEFALLLNNVSTKVVEQVATRVITALQAPFLLGGKSLTVTASVGVVTVEDDGDNRSVDDLMRDADLAMYVAKSLGKNRHVRFEASMRDQLSAEVSLKDDLRYAIENDGFEVYYQPIVALDTLDMSSAEALLRWTHPEKGAIPPLNFIPVAEETGMILPIGEFVLRTACNDIAALQRQYPERAPKSISVNASSKQLQEESFVEIVKDALQASGLAADCLTIEVTESILLDGGNGVLERVQELHDIGVKFAIDDFGTGYSSFNYLRQFPIDILKVDRAFVSGLGSETQDSVLTQAIIAVGQTMQLTTVGEGVETVEEMEELKRIGCDRGQGYLFSRPVPIDQFTQLVAPVTA